MPKEEIDLPQLVEIDILVSVNNGELKDIIGLYTKDEEGNKTLKRVKENMERVHPERHLSVHTYCTNIPNR